MSSILTTKPTKTQKMMMVFGTVLIMAMCMALTMFAGPETATATTIQDGIKSGMSQVYTVITAIVVPVGAVCFAWNVFKIFTGGQKEMDAAKKNLLVTCVVVAGVYLAPAIIQQVSTWFSDNAGSVSTVFGTPSPTPGH